MRFSFALLALAASAAASASEPVVIGKTVEARVTAVSPLRSTVSTSTEECRLAPTPDVDRLSAALMAGQRQCITTTATSRDPDGYLVSLRTSDGVRLSGRMQTAPAVGARLQVPLAFVPVR